MFSSDVGQCRWCKMLDVKLLIMHTVTQIVRKDPEPLIFVKDIDRKQMGMRIEGVVL